MQVLKFGGSSVASAENIRKSMDIIKKALNQKATIVVVSAFGGMTDLLVETSRQAEAGDENYLSKLHLIEKQHLQVIKDLIPLNAQSAVLSLVKRKCNELEKICEGVFILQELSVRTLDHIVGFGELLSSLIISATLHSRHEEHRWLDSRELIKTDSNYGLASVDFANSNHLICEAINQDGQKLFLLPGYIASNENGTPTTLGRGGSDYTAAILASALNADVLEIWTDVSGLMTADPRLVNHAKAIPHISYKEAMELSYFGAKVIYPPTIQPVMNKGIPIRIRNTFAPDEIGTLIESDVPGNRDSVRGLSSISHLALLSLEGSGMVGIPGSSNRLFEALSREKINVIFITQSSSEYSICVAIDEREAHLAKQKVNEAFRHEIQSGLLEPLISESGLSMIALVGDRMKNHPGIAGRMFSALGRNGVNIRAIAQGSSEKNISAVVRTADLKKALNILHEEFFETSFKQINLFIVGAGNVGSRLIEQVKSQQEHLRTNFKLELKIRGIANSRTMILSEGGLCLENWVDLLGGGEPANMNRLLSFIGERNLRNSVFIDVTANEVVAGLYPALLKQSISVVACNKIACSSAFSNYQTLKALASEFNTSFLFETNVGASLPIIGTLNDLIRSGDTVVRIEAVLSGTLNYVFNYYDGSSSFAGIVRQAQEEGYTEPDPRTDLSGIDVMRKILILAREAGHVLEMDDLVNRPFLPSACMEGDVANFYRELENNEAHFYKLFQEASLVGCKLKFVATLTNGKAEVGLQHVSQERDLFHLYGKDNVVVFYTARYKEQPLVIKGAGAGAEITASGIFADVIRAARIGV